MDLQLKVLEARRRVLSHPIPSVAEPVSGQTQQVVHDPFAFESHGFFVSARDGSGLNKDSDDERDAREALRTERRKIVQQQKARSSKLSKANAKPKRARRFVTNWTPEMDKVVRKALSKHGWGCWSKIAQSGKLPKEYNSKLIANRARSIGLTKEMFGPQVSYAASKL